MQEFPWPGTYDAVFIVWAAGSLSHLELVSFLAKAKRHLSGSRQLSSSRSVPSSFIFVLDSVLAPKEEPVTIKGQRVRSLEKFRRIFGRAGLTIH